MSQPKWKLLWSTDYSALWDDETGVYQPELAIAQEYENAQGKTRFQIFRFSVDKLKKVRRGDLMYLVSDAWDESWPHPLPQYEAWFVKDLKNVANSIDASVKDLIDDLTSDDPGRRASAYESIGGYHGFNNFDDYPREWSEKKMDKDWPS